MCVCVAFLFLFGSCTKDSPAAGFLLPDDVVGLDNAEADAGVFAGNEKAAEEPNDCGCEFRVRSNRASESGSLNNTWSVRAVGFYSTSVQVGGSGNMTYTNIGNWQYYPLPGGGDTSGELLAFVGGGYLLPITIETQIICNQAWPSPYLPLTLDLDCPGAPMGCDGASSESVEGSVVDCGARIAGVGDPNG